MAGQLLNVTGSMVTLTAAATPTTTQKGSEALDLLGFPAARLDFCLKVFARTGTSVVISLYTSMYNDDNKDNWVLLGTAFASVTASNVTSVRSVSTEILRYIRWQAVLTSVTVVSFEILGVAR